MRRLLALSCLPLAALALAACGAAPATSTAGFSGAEREVAQTIANLQSNATSAEERKICEQDLAASVVSRLGGVKGCEAAIKTQLNGIDNLEVSVASVKLAPHGTTATATVRSIHEGKTRPSNVSLVKEGGKWKISGL
jgi:Domain of unknown function (DUF4878)